MNVISVPRPATEPSMKTLLNLVMGLSKHLECTGHLYRMNLTMVSSFADEETLWKRESH